MPLLKGTGRKEDDIRRRAYEIYLARVSKGEAANEKQDWFEAERWFNARFAGLKQRAAKTARWGARESFVGIYTCERARTS